MANLSLIPMCGLNSNSVNFSPPLEQSVSLCWIPSNEKLLPPVKSLVPACFPSVSNSSSTVSQTGVRVSLSVCLLSTDSSPAPGERHSSRSNGGGPPSSDSSPTPGERLSSWSNGGGPPSSDSSLAPGERLSSRSNAGGPPSSEGQSRHIGSTRTSSRVGAGGQSSSSSSS
uniref:Uncharacterized protein n=1 Tax=Cacopsylla melanoneura TaxID=428564 RepID=A0A8D8RXA4_9HEMI